MSKWHKFAKKGEAEQEGLTQHLTMHLRQVLKKDGSVHIEQLVEYRNQQNMVAQTEWVKIPLIMEN